MLLLYTPRTLQRGRCVQQSSEPKGYKPITRGRCWSPTVRGVGIPGAARDILGAAAPPPFEVKTPAYQTDARFPIRTKCTQLPTLSLHSRPKPTFRSVAWRVSIETNNERLDGCEQLPKVFAAS